MLERMDTWVLLALLFGVMVCMLAAAWAKNRYLSAELDRALKNNSALVRNVVDVADALDRSMRREKSARSHREHMLEEKLKKQAEVYEKELTMWKCKYNSLEHAMHSMWPNAPESRAANE